MTDEFLTASLTADAVHTDGQRAHWWIEKCTELLRVDRGGQLSFELKIPWAKAPCGFESRPRQTRDRAAHDRRPLGRSVTIVGVKTIWSRIGYFFIRKCLAELNASFSVTESGTDDALEMLLIGAGGASHDP
jgi:hypothetical protein